MSALHKRAKPLIKRLWTDAQRTGLPIARPLWLHHPADEKARKEDQQWLLGPDVLVAPVVEEGATSNEVYFPRGCWQHGETGQRFEGPKSVKVEAPLDKGPSLPWFVRCGTRPLEAKRAGDRPLPRVRFRLSFKAGRHKGRRCAGRVIHGRIVGSGVRKVRRVVFYGDGKRVARDSRRPFRKRIHRHKDRKVHMNTFEARVTFKDGRKRTMRIKQLGCKRKRSR